MNNLSIIEAYHKKLWDDKALSVIDEYFAHDVLIHSPIKTTQGTKDFKSVIMQWYRAFPDLLVHWDDYICENDKVVSRWHAQGCQKGTFLEIEPSNKRVEYSGVTIYQLKDNNIVQYWALIDMETLKSQLK